MDKKEYSRRRFLKRNLMTGRGVVFAADGFSGTWINGVNTTDKPALLGGEPVHPGNWPDWPVWNASTDEEQLLKVIRSGVWSRAEVVDELEKAWAQTIGTKRCLSVVNGTNALIAALVNLGTGGGDELMDRCYSYHNYGNPYGTSVGAVGAGTKLRIREYQAAIGLSQMKRLEEDFNRYLEQNQCPENDRLCNEEAVWIPQNILPAAQADMDDISRAIEKIHKQAGALKEKAERN